MLCAKYKPHSNKSSASSSRSDARPATNIQRRDFWTTVLSDGMPSSSRPSASDVLSDSEYTGLVPRAGGARASSSRPPTGASDGSRRGSGDDHRRTSGGARKETPCPNCHTMFKRKYDLIQHVSAVHEKLRPYPCEKCSMCFAHKGTLHKHVRTVHLGEKPFICEHCKQRFSERGNVNKHKQRVKACRDKENAARSRG